MQPTPIEWTDFSANPLKYRDANGKVVWACVHASPGCTNCYSEQLAKRYGRGGRFDVPTTSKLTPFLDEKELRAMLTCRAASGKRCFPFDMTDLFGECVPDELLHRVFYDVLEHRHDATWQLLTKRAQRAHDYLSWRWKDRLVPRHIWIGVSVEDQKRAEERIQLLLQTPAAVRFISAEPLLGPVDLTEIVIGGRGEEYDPVITLNALNRPPMFGPRLSWVIVGGESGPQARPMDLAWARSIVQQCKAADLPVFVKQLGARPYVNDDLVGFAKYRDAMTLPGYEAVLRDRNGGDPAEWPEDLRIREFPSQVTP